MRSRRALIILGLAVIGVIVLANLLRQVVLPATLIDTDNIVLGETYRLDRRISDDLVVLADSITLESSSYVRGDVALIGGRVSVGGRVDGDLTVLSERVHIEPGAIIRGDTTLLVAEAIIDGRISGELNIRSDAVTIQPDALIDSDVYICADSLTDQRAGEQVILPCNQSIILADLEPLDALRHLNSAEIAFGAGGAILSLAASLGLSGLAVLAVAIFPRQISHIEEAIRARPRNQGILGFMLILLLLGISFAVAVALAALPVLGLLLIPLYLIVGLVVLGMALAGWVTVALVCGDVLLSRVVKAPLPPLIIAAVGNIALVGVWHLLVLTPYSRVIGLGLALLLVCVGLGGVLTTRLGTKPVYRSYLVQG